MGAPRLIGIACLAAAAALGAPPSQATPPAVRGGPGVTLRAERPVPRGEAVAIAAMRAYSACLARAAEAPLLLRTMPGSDGEAAIIRTLTKGNKGCRPNGQLRFLAYFLRGALAEGLYTVEETRRGAMSAAAPSETFGAFVARLTAARRDGLDAMDLRIMAWRWLAYCAAHRDPAAAAALIRSEPSSPGEVAAVRALRPALAGCLPEDQWADLRAVAMRALLAEALYQRQLARVAP